MFKQMIGLWTRVGISKMTTCGREWLAAILKHLARVMALGTYRRAQEQRIYPMKRNYLRISWRTRLAPSGRTITTFPLNGTTSSAISFRQPLQTTSTSEWAAALLPRKSSNTASRITYLKVTSLKLFPYSLATSNLIGWFNTSMQIRSARKYSLRREIWSDTPLESKLCSTRRMSALYG